MQAKEVVRLTEELSTPILDKLGLEFVDCEYVKEGASWFLRVIIDKEGGVTIDESEAASRQISEVLDDKITKEAYTFEVSSPGLDRVLKRDKEYVKYKGREVEVKLFKAVEGNKEFLGILEGLEDNKVVITAEGGERLSFERDKIAATRLHIDF